MEILIFLDEKKKWTLRRVQGLKVQQFLMEQGRTGMPSANGGYMFTLCQALWRTLGCRGHSCTVAAGTTS
jgi:hypothetical protein